MKAPSLKLSMLIMLSRLSTQTSMTEFLLTLLIDFGNRIMSKKNSMSWLISSIKLINNSLKTQSELKRQSQRSSMKAQLKLIKHGQFLIDTEKK